MLKIRNFLKYRKCVSCGKEFLAYSAIKINKDEFICSECSRGNSYYTKNFLFTGKERDISFSFEFETSSNSKSLFELRKYNFIGCSDGSITGLEWKSPFFYSKKTFHCVCKKINKFARFVGQSCGTHLHVSTDYKLKMDRYKRELFKPIIRVMLENEEKTRKFWGRFFGHYCHSDIRDFDRYNAFNTISSVDTLEFRLLKFINADQYIRACDFCIDTTRFLNNNMKDEEFNEEKAKKLGEMIADKYREVIKDV